jgi:hypothetical protein
MSAHEMEKTMPMTDDELHAMPCTRDLMTAEELSDWIASRGAAGRAIDIETCELGCWAAYDCDPYGACDLRGTRDGPDRNEPLGALSGKPWMGQ